MQITDVRIRKITKEGKMRAVVSITLDNDLLYMTLKLSKVRKDCLLPCRAVDPAMENFAM